MCKGDDDRRQKLWHIAVYIIQCSIHRQVCLGIVPNSAIPHLLLLLLIKETHFE